MRYNNIVENDVINGEGVSLSFWTQGCPHHCPGCHNPETWSFNGGIEIDNEYELITEIINKINQNGIQRNLSILGGEPLCDTNVDFVCKLLAAAKFQYPTIKTFVWTGYTIEQLKELYDINIILSNIDILIEGPFELDKRDITLKLRGSTNQRILYKGIDF